MASLRTGTPILFVGLLALASFAQDAAKTAPPPRLVVGTFDSRAVLIAYVGSDAFQEYVTAQKTDIGKALDRARAEGDTAMAKALEALGPDMQQRIHEQGFGATPIDDLLVRLKGELPRVAKEAGCDLIVSKWQVTYRAPEARTVDVTDRLAACFDPSEKTWQSIHQIVTQPPVPLDKLKPGH